MAKRGRPPKSEASNVVPAKKGRPPKSRNNKTPPMEKSVSTVSSKTEVKKKTTVKASPKPKKSVESKSQPKKTKTATASPKKSIGKVSSPTVSKSNVVQKTPPKPPAKRGRKPKIKNATPEKKAADMKTTPLVPPEDDEDTEEEHMSDTAEMNQRSTAVPTTSISSVGSSHTGSGGDTGLYVGGTADSNQFKPHLTTDTSHTRFESTTSTTFDNPPHSANFSALGSLYNSQKLISSSSTSAFSVPIPPPAMPPMPSTVAAPVSNLPEFNANHLLPHPMITNETNMSNMMPTAAPIPPVTLSAPQPTPIMAASHQSLLSPPQNSANPNDPVHDLPTELLQQGWRKFWSRREGRPYYFNKNTNESLWEMPKLSNVYDPMTDPLGIQSPSFPPPPTPTDPGTPPIYPVFNPSFLQFMQKNANNSTMNNDKKTYVGPFDFEIESNCYIWEGLFFYYFHPHPEVELTRFNYVHKLRQNYHELCRARQNIDPPKDSFTKWILERKVIDKGCDPFLPSECTPEMSQSLYNEIMNDIPIKLVKPKFSGEARKQLSKYAEAAKKIIDSPHVSAMNRKIVKWNVEDAFEWIRKTLNATYEDYIERLEHLKTQCQPHITEAAKSSVESICLKIYHVSADYSRRIREHNLEIFRKEDLKDRGPYRFSNQKRVICYPAYLINPCPKLPMVQCFPEKENSLLRFKSGEIIKINTSYLQKLEMLYFFNCRDDRKYSLFLTRVWCLLKRYQSFFDKTEGFSSQNSLPLSVFGALNKHFGVTFECFASPLNCYFRQYCSLFPDTDGYFGSRGSILNFYPMSGSFEAYPPDSDDLIDASINHFEKLLENSMEPLSFIIFIQEKSETPQKILSRLESNKFKRERLTIQQMEHEYRHGFQHLFPRSEVSVVSPSNTLIYFLQNDAGFLRWGPTPERVEELMESFKLGRDSKLTFFSPPSTPAAANQKPVVCSASAATTSATTPTSITEPTVPVENRPNGI